MRALNGAFFWCMMIALILDAAIICAVFFLASGD